MFEDARRVRDGTRIETDLCIVGAGAAGVSLAMELIGSGLRVCLLEAGGERPDRATQSLLAGEAPGYPDCGLEETRVACLGGTTRVWSGWCRPLDSADFEPRSWVDESGWPFPRTELDPFYRRAQALCGLGPFDYDASAWRSEAGSALRLPGRLVETRLYHMSPPLRFGRAYRTALEEATDVRVLLHAVCTELVPDRSARRIETVRAATLRGGALEIAARFTVLAAGGIENPRLLLLSGDERAGGLGNAHGLVGRYFMEHPYVTAGLLHLADGAEPGLSFYHPHHAARDGGRARIRGVFTVPRERLRAEGLLATAFFPLPVWEAAGSLESAGAASLRELAAMARRGWLPARGWAHVLGAARDPVGVLGAIYHRLLRPWWGPRHPNVVRMRAFCEAIPRRSRAVRLTGSRDRLGRRRVRVDWELDDLERRSLSRGYELLEQALSEAKVGRLDWNLDVGDGGARIETGRHHMGSTRMHRDPSRGVVDPDGRVHGIENLFIAGSSVFPTAGFANPTLTIVALAVRLADRLKGIAARGGSVSA